MVRIYTLPLFAFRPMYYTMRNFKKAFHDIVMSRRAIRNMNTLYPNATPEELAAADNVCIICRYDHLNLKMSIYILHFLMTHNLFKRGNGISKQKITMQSYIPHFMFEILVPTSTNLSHMQIKYFETYHYNSAQQAAKSTASSGTCSIKYTTSTTSYSRTAEYTS